MVYDVLFFFCEFKIQFAGFSKSKQEFADQARPGCHLRGSFIARDNVAPAVSALHVLAEPAAFDYGKLSHPPVTYRQEKLKGDARLPAARLGGTGISSHTRRRTCSSEFLLKSKGGTPDRISYIIAPKE